MKLTLLSRVAYQDQEVSGPRLRGLLALLATDLRAGCSTTRLVSELWPEAQPEHPTKALQILVSRVRSQLGSDLIARTGAGYRLALAEEQVDAAAVQLSAAAAARSARAGDHAAALAHAEAGLACWDGPPTDTAVAGDDPVTVLRAERAATYRALARARTLALARLGRYGEALDPLTELVETWPRDEEALAGLLRCEAATAGPAAALARFEAYRRALRDELGADPGAPLQDLHQQLLRGEAPAVRTGVPYEPNPLLGRDGDLAAVTELLRTSRVVSIVGTGGLGKTRLAYAVARQARLPAVHLVPLAGMASDGDVATEAASALGVGDSRRVATTADPVTGIAAALGPGPALLVLDNCEHVVTSVAELVGALVAMSREVRVLTSSRSPLGLSSESVYLLPELPLPVAVELFGQRARAARANVDLPAETVTELCRRLDGLPLAIELAAAQVRTRTVAEIAQHLAGPHPLAPQTDGVGDRFALLRGGPRDAPERHHTLQAVVDWSWSLLSPAGQAAMRALSIFPGGFTVDAAQQLDVGPEVLALLVDQSLLTVVDTPAGARFSMLETVREFGAARREEASESERAVNGLLAWARSFGLSHHAALFGADSFATAQRVRAEQDNLALALRHGLARSDDASVAAVGAVLAGLWTLDSAYTRMLTLMDETAGLLSHARPASDELVESVRTLAVLATTTTYMLRGPRATRWLAILRRLPPAPMDTPIGALTRVLAAFPEMAADPAVLPALCDSDAPLVAGAANGVACYVWEGQGEPERALAAARRLLAAVEHLPGPWFRLLAHSRVSELSAHLERGEQARHHLATALRLMEESGPWSDVVQIRWSMVLVSLLTGAVDEAERWLELAAQGRSEEPSWSSAFDLAARAEVELVRGEVEAGLRRWRHAAEQATAGSDPLFELQPGGLDPWTLEIQAACVVAHAQHGRLELVDNLAAELPRQLATLLDTPATHPPSFAMELPLYGTLLLAPATVDLERDRTTVGVRMVALAQRCQYLRRFQPTMSTGRARAAAEQADWSAYTEAVSAYADLDPAGLRAAARDLLDQWAGSRR